MSPYILLSFIIGAVVGFSVFYFRYQHRDTVNQLRSSLKDANREVHSLNQEIEEYLQQNVILKDKMSEFLGKNDDLSKVVGELSKYYYHIKKAAEKTQELTKYLNEPDPEIEEKMQVYLIGEHMSKNENKDSDLIGKGFF